MFELRGLIGAKLDSEQILRILRRTIGAELRGHRLSASPEDPLALELTQIGSDEPALSLNAHNIVQEILRNGYGRAEAGHRIAQFAGMIAAAMEPREIDHGALYLALRHHASTAGSGAARMAGAGLGDLRVVVAEDRGAFVSLPSEAMLEKAGLTRKAARATGLENLRGVLPRLEIFEEDRGVETLVLEDYDWLSSSLLLAPTLLQRFARGKGWKAALIAAPAVDAIHLVDADRKDALPVLEALMRESFANSRRHSGCVFRLKTRGDEIPRVACTMHDGHLAAAN